MLTYEQLASMRDRALLMAEAALRANDYNTMRRYEMIWNRLMVACINKELQRFKV